MLNLLIQFIVTLFAAANQGLINQRDADSPYFGKLSNYGEQHDVPSKYV